MDEQNLDLAMYVEQMAIVLDLPIKAYLSGVIDNFAKLQAIAQLVNEFPLPEDIEAAAVFEP